MGSWPGPAHRNQRSTPVPRRPQAQVRGPWSAAICSDAGLAGGGLMGWLFDSWLGTSPGFLLGFLFLGIGVAFRNIIRISQERPK